MQFIVRNSGRYCRLNNARAFLLAGAGFFCACVSGGCSRPPAEISRAMVLMGTTARISIVTDRTVSAAKAREAAGEAFDLLGAYERKMSFYDPESELSRLNARAAAAPVKVSAELMAVIEEALEFGRQTQGAFDVTAVSLQTPDGYANIILDQERGLVSLPDAAAKIDLGGITVGYALDRVVDLFARLGVQNYLIDVGGDIYAAGHNQTGKTWSIGIRDPFNNHKLVKEIALKDQAVTTSGNYLRGHIVDPAGAALPRDGLVSVTVIAGRAVDADVLATAFFVMGLERAREFLKTRKDIKAVFIRADNGKPSVLSVN